MMVFLISERRTITVVARPRPPSPAPSDDLSRSKSLCYHHSFLQQSVSYFILFYAFLRTYCLNEKMDVCPGFISALICVTAWRWHILCADGPGVSFLLPFITGDLMFAHIQKSDEREGRGYVCVVMNDVLRMTVVGPRYIIQVWESMVYFSHLGYNIKTIHMSRLVGKPTLWFPNRSDTNWAV